MMTFGTVLYEVKERVATITLNRPERFNAISETMPEDIAAAFQPARPDSKQPSKPIPTGQPPRRMPSCGCSRWWMRGCRCSRSATTPFITKTNTWMHATCAQNCAWRSCKNFHVSWRQGRSMDWN